MNLREQFESELKSTGVKLLFESSAPNYIKWLEAKNKALTEQLRIGGVSQQRELKPQVKREKATWQCDDCDKWYEPSNSCPHCGFCG